MPIILQKSKQMLTNVQKDIHNDIQYLGDV
jgi:hypothetical protein